MKKEHQPKGAEEDGEAAGGEVENVDSNLSEGALEQEEAGGSDTDDENGEDSSSEEEEEVGVALQLPKRATRGQAYQRLVGDALRDDQEFWGHDTWAEEEEDADYICSEGEEVYEDIVDSDFDKAEEDSDSSAEEEEENKRKKGKRAGGRGAGEAGDIVEDDEELAQKRKKRNAYQDLWKKKQKQQEKQARAQATKDQKRVKGSRAPGGEEGDGDKRKTAVVQEKIGETSPQRRTRDSTRQHTQLVARRLEAEKALQQKRKTKKTAWSESGATFREPSLEEHLAEARLTEARNVASLVELQEKEEARKLRYVDMNKRVYKGDFDTYISWASWLIVGDAPAEEETAPVTDQSSSCPGTGAAGTKEEDKSGVGFNGQERGDKTEQESKEGAEAAPTEAGPEGVFKSGEVKGSATDKKEDSGGQKEKKDDEEAEDGGGDDYAMELRMFTDGKFPEIYHQQPLSPPPRFVCPISGLEAKYVDPLSGVRYATTHAFKCIREAYHCLREKQVYQALQDTKEMLDEYARSTEISAISTPQGLEHTVSFSTVSASDLCTSPTYSALSQNEKGTKRSLSASVHNAGAGLGELWMPGAEEAGERRRNKKPRGHSRGGRGRKVDGKEKNRRSHDSAGC
ncbi:yl1 nuclear protein c-terminal domain-containing protein [Cystoisospora suis]|uniref:Yl1 nuclear protein c-terminal domain-containing protein n=1 Tax=Cystoisospora suis TaxID=483139 RepID=A0A2C6KFS6_9APIC|nr:yl1 nuclear protein c-terminal domain-containing protein [Cystoisospora suis]